MHRKGDISIPLAAVFLISTVIAISLLFYNWYSQSLEHPMAKEKERHKHDVQCYREVIKIKDVKYLGLLGSRYLVQNQFNDSSTTESEKFYAPPKMQVVYVRLPKNIEVKYANLKVQGGLN